MTPKDASLPVSQSSKRYIYFMKSLSPWMAGTALFLTLYAVYTNYLNMTVLLTPYEGGAATSLATGLSVSSIALAIMSKAISWLRLTLLCLGLATALTAQTFPDFWTSLAAHVAMDGKMGLNTSLIIALLALSHLLAPRFYKTGAALALAGFVILSNCLLGLSFGAVHLSGHMALGSIAAMLLLTFATLTRFLNFAPTRILFLDSPIGHSTRTMVFMSVTAPWACGLVLHHLIGVQERDYPVEAMMFTAIIATGIVMAIRSGNFLERTDAQRRAAATALEVLALTDPLTGLYNREGAKRLLRQRRLSVQNAKRESAIVFVDIDHFKTINDSHGHAVGDLVLKSIQPAIAPVLDKSDIITRWGGDEFMIYVEIETVESLPARVEQMRAAVANLANALSCEEGCTGSSLPDTVTASFGVSLWDRSRRFETALERADIALYRAKHRGRNCIDCDGFIRAAARTAEAKLARAAQG